MKKVMLLSGLCAMALLGACNNNNKKVEPIAKPPVAPIETAPMGSTPAILGAPAGSIAVDTGVTAPPPAATPGDVVLKSDKDHKHAAKAPVAKEGKKAATVAHGHKYVVKKGDTLASIAKKAYGKSSTSTVKKIIAANPKINPNKILVGQTIILP